jgi:GNAT superfamily N-acetyltransferase
LKRVFSTSTVFIPNRQYKTNYSIQMKTKVTTYYLHMTDPAELRPSRKGGIELQVQRAEIPCPELNRFLYTAVGGDWYWIDRLSWTYDRWLEYLDRPELETWVGYISGTPVGYYELEIQWGANVEIAYFGLFPQFIGRGVGGDLLTKAIERTWAMGAARVWVHTCSLDGPSALANYQARGLRLYKEEETEVDLPEEPPGPWPGASKKSTVLSPES